MGKVYILRGISGSGKSHYAKKLIESLQEGVSHVIASADDYFMHHGEYLFNPKKLSEAHAHCMATFLKALADGADVIIVDNTNVCTWQYKNYALAAKLANYSVSVKQLHGDEISYERCEEFSNRNDGRAPVEKVLFQMENWEPTPNMEKDKWYADS